MRRLVPVSAWSVLAAALAAALLVPPALAAVAGAAAAGAATQPVAVGTGGAVASMDLGASAAGISVLKRGGNAVGAAGGSTIITTILQIILNHVDFGMSLPAALAAPRVSQTNSPTSLAEPDFYNGALAKQLTSQFGEQFTLATGPILPLDNYPGDATGIQFLGHGRFQAVAEPVRLGGGSALVVNPSP